jgi:hypothetical protein
MTNLKELLNYELKRDVPYTQKLEQRILAYVPKKKYLRKWSIFGSAAVAITAACLLILIQFSPLNEQPISLDQPKDVLIAKEDVPSNMDDLLAMLQQNETIIPFKEKASKNEVLYTNETIYPFYSGKNFPLADLNIFVTKEAPLYRGNYALINQEGHPHVRQVLAFEGESYYKVRGELFVDGKKVMLPGMLATDLYMTEAIYRYSSWYFDLLQNGDRTSTDPVTLQEGEMLVVSIDDQYNKVQVIKTVSILGKVTGVQYEEPSFMLTSDAAKRAKAFTKTYDTNLFVNEDPLFMAQLFMTYLYEGNVEALYALSPTVVEENNYTIEQFREVVYGPENLLTDKKAVQSILAASYYGLEKGDVTYGTFSDQYATVTFKGKEKTLYNTYSNTIAMIKNEQGFWEVEHLPSAVIY